MIQKMVMEKALQGATQSKDGGIPPLFKGIISLVVVGGAAFLGYKIYKLIKSSAESKDAKAVGDAATKDLKQEINKGQTVSKPLSAYASAVTFIQKQLNGCTDVGEERSVINQIISVVKKPADWFYLVQLWNSKKIEDCLWGSYNADLPTALKTELTSAMTTIKVDNFEYNPSKDKYKNGYQVLQQYLKKIGVTI